MRLVLLVLVIASAAARLPAQEPSSPWLRAAELGGRLNPDGANLRLWMAWRSVYDRDWVAQRSDAFVELGAMVDANTAFVRPALWATWQAHPAVVLDVQAGPTWYFTSSSGAIPFPSAEASFGDDVLDAREALAEDGWGARAAARLTLQAAAGPVFVRNRTRYVHFDLPGEGPFVYETEFDTLVEPSDQIIDNEFYVGGVFTDSAQHTALGGVFHTWQEVQGSELERQRVGLFGGWIQQLCARRQWQVNAQVGWNLDDPNREDEAFVQGNVGFRF